MSHTHYKPKNQLRHGELHGDVYSKTVSGSIHRLKRPPAWAVDARDLVEAERRGAVRIEICDLETQITYTATIEQFRARALPVNRGYGPQLALELRDWTYTAPLKTGGVLAVKVSDPRPRPRQISLFEGVHHGR
jgi:hypothetical protein